MRFLTLALMLSAVAVTFTSAEVTIEDETQAEERTTTTSGKASARRAAKLSPEELQKKKEEKKRRNRKLESCLILTRAYYS